MFFSSNQELQNVKIMWWARNSVSEICISGECIKLAWDQNGWPLLSFNKFLKAIFQLWHLFNSQYLQSIMRSVMPCLYVHCNQVWKPYVLMLLPMHHLYQLWIKLKTRWELTLLLYSHFNKQYGLRKSSTNFVCVTTILTAGYARAWEFHFEKLPPHGQSVISGKRHSLQVNRLALSLSIEMAIFPFSGYVKFGPSVGGYLVDKQILIFCDLSHCNLQ